jgi:hypothetical protein
MLPFRGKHFSEKARVKSAGIKQAIEEAFEEEKKQGGPPAELEEDEEQEQATVDQEEARAKRKAKQEKAREERAKRESEKKKKSQTGDRKRKRDEGSSGGEGGSDAEAEEKERKQKRRLKRKSESGSNGGGGGEAKADEPRKRAKSTGGEKAGNGEATSEGKKPVKRESTGGEKAGNGGAKDAKDKEERKRKREERQKKMKEEGAEGGEKRQKPKQPKKPMDEAAVKQRLASLHVDLKRAAVQKSASALVAAIKKIKATPITIQLLHVRPSLPTANDDASSPFTLRTTHIHTGNGNRAYGQEAIQDAGQGHRGAVSRPAQALCVGHGQRHSEERRHHPDHPGIQGSCSPPAHHRRLGRLDLVGLFFFCLCAANAQAIAG